MTDDSSKMAKSPSKKSCPHNVVDNTEHMTEMSILDLPELALDCILSKLAPTELSNAAAVCRSLREKCQSDFLWERHMTKKWERLISSVARREWQLHLPSAKDASISSEGTALQSKWFGAISCVWPISWIKSRIENGNKLPNSVSGRTIMFWYQSLENGKFRFPAQVYNREHGHQGFLLSCYDAEVSYDRHTDTFKARYPPHGRRAEVLEESIKWERLRAPPVNASAYDLYLSDCLNELCPGDHIEIQWRRTKDLPYGWWYGVVGHLDSCDGNEYLCRCRLSDTIFLEFNHYAPGSIWRRGKISRKDHKEEGNESDGFYGGIRKLKNTQEISKWKKFWPNDILE